MEQTLARVIAAFNDRRYAEAAALADEGCRDAEGRDELFWFGLSEVCDGFALLMDGKPGKAESRLLGAMEKLRNFGYEYRNFEITAALAGVRRALEEIRDVRQGHRKSFDVTLLPSLRMAAQADL
jgi:hypothetical protein